MQSRNVEFIEVSVPVSDFYDLEVSDWPWDHGPCIGKAECFAHLLDAISMRTRLYSLKR